MEIPTKLRSVLAGFHYWLLALILLASSVILISCSGGSDTTITITDSNVPPANVGSIILTIKDDSFEVGGITSEVTAEVFNLDGNPVPDGTSVNFAVEPIGIIPVAAATKNGIATTVLTSGTIAGEYYLIATAGGAADIAFGEFTPLPANSVNTTLTANPTSIPADGTSTSEITLVARDIYGNPTSGNLAFATTDGDFIGDISSNETLGIYSVTLVSSTDLVVATVTAKIGPVSKTVDVGFGLSTGVGSGTAIDVITGANPLSIRVKNTEGSETAILTATAYDETLSQISDCDNNIQFDIIGGPGGGELLDGVGTSVVKSTSNGMASAVLSSGTISGTVNIRVTIIRDGDCSNPIVAPGYATAISVPVVIEAGPPDNITVFPEDGVIENGDATYSMFMNAFVQDVYGNPVEGNPDEFDPNYRVTAIYFGLSDDRYGAICGTAFTGDLKLDALCDATIPVPSDSLFGSVKGIAHSRLTWYADSVGQPYEVTASYGGVSGTFANSYPLLEPAE